VFSQEIAVGVSCCNIEGLYILNGKIKEISGGIMEVFILTKT
jgi:hypothetical protein